MIFQDNGNNELEEAQNTERAQDMKKDFKYSSFLQIKQPEWGMTRDWLAPTLSSNLSSSRTFLHSNTSGQQSSRARLTGFGPSIFKDLKRPSSQEAITPKVRNSTSQQKIPHTRSNFFLKPDMKSVSSSKLVQTSSGTTSQTQSTLPSNRLMKSSSSSRVMIKNLLYKQDLANQDVIENDKYHEKEIGDSGRNEKSGQIEQVDGARKFTKKESTFQSSNAEYSTDATKESQKNLIHPYKIPCASKKKDKFQKYKPDQNRILEKQYYTNSPQKQRSVTHIYFFFKLYLIQ